MMDKIFAVGSLITLFAFVGVVLGFVAEVDLTIVVVIVLLMATYDFWKTLWGGNGNGNGKND
jgi:hypothetical protein